jgi:hypothetical protein
LAQGYGQVFLPNALEKKYPNLNREWGWQYVFPALHRSKDPNSEIIRRHHLLERPVQRAVKLAMTSARITKHGSCHTFRHFGHDLSTSNFIIPNHSKSFQATQNLSLDLGFHPWLGCDPLAQTSF